MNVLALRLSREVTERADCLDLVGSGFLLSSSHCRDYIQSHIILRR